MNRDEETLLSISRRAAERLVIYEFLSCSTNIPRGLSVYEQ